MKQLCIFSLEQAKKYKKIELNQLGTFSKLQIENCLDSETSSQLENFNV